MRSALLLCVPSGALVDGRGEEISCDGRGSAERLPLAVLQDSYQNRGVKLHVDHTHIFLLFF